MAISRNTFATQFTFCIPESAPSSCFVSRRPALIAIWYYTYVQSPLSCTSIAIRYQEASPCTVSSHLFYLKFLSADEKEEKAFVTEM